MKRVIILLVCGLLSGATLLAQASMAGQWSVEWDGEFKSPSEFSMYLSQDGSKLTGHVDWAAGDFPIRGTIEKDQFTLTWRYLIAGKMTDITFTGTLKDNSITGKVIVGDSKSEGSLYGERTGP